MSTVIAARSRVAATAQRTGPPARRLPASGRPVPRSLRQQTARSHDEQNESGAASMGAFPGEDAPGTGETERMAAAYIERGPNCPRDQRVAASCLSFVALIGDSC